MREKLITALRWIAVIPAACAAYFVIQIFVILITALWGDIPAWVVQVGNSYAGAWAMVLCGAVTAPAKRRSVAIVLATIISGAYVVLTLIASAMAFPLMGIISGIATAGGAIHGVVVTVRIDRKTTKAGA